MLPASIPQSLLGTLRSLDVSHIPEHVHEHDPVGLLRGLICVGPGKQFEDLCTPGWTEEMHFIRESFLKGARDAFAVKVAQAFFFPSWETMPEVLTRTRVQHRANRVRTSGTTVHPRLAAGLVKIESWKLGEDSSSDDHALFSLSMHPAGSSPSDGFRALQSVVPEEVQAALKAVPCISLPPALGQLVFGNRLRNLVFLARWVHPDFPVLCQGLSEDWLLERKGAAPSQPFPPACLDASAAERCVAVMRSMLSDIIATDAESDHVEGIRSEALRCIVDITKHKSSLCLVPDDAARKFASVASHDSFLRQILASLDLRNRGQLKSHALRFLQCLPAGVRPGAEAWVREHFASSTSPADGRVMLDIAMLLFQRAKLSRLGPVLRYIWGDSTSKGHKDIYNVRYRFLAAADAVELARSFKWLCMNQADKAKEAEAEDGDEMPADVEKHRQRAKLSQSLFDRIEMHTQIPQLLGQGRTQLVDKVGAHVLSALLECT